MPDFNMMDRSQLSAWYIANVGYDLGADDPGMTLECFREICTELHDLYNEVPHEFDHAGQRWSFNGDEVAMLDDEDGRFHFAAYHGLSQPTVESVTAFIDAM